MKGLLSRLLSPLVVALLGLLALSALIWFLGPLIAIGESRPLEPFWLRVTLLVLLWGVWLGIVGWRAWRSCPGMSSSVRRGRARPRR